MSTYDPTNQSVTFSVSITKEEFLAHPTIPELDQLIAIKIRTLKQVVTVKSLREVFLPPQPQGETNAGNDGSTPAEPADGVSHTEQATDPDRNSDFVGGTT